VKHPGAADFAMGRSQLQREEDQTVISCESYEASNYKGNPHAPPLQPGRRG